MLQLLKRVWLVPALLFAGAQSMLGFALMGPLNEAFQDPTIGYNEQTAPAIEFGDIGGFTDVGGPKNLGEGYRWNTPTLYYAFDASFIDYFGSNGVAAVDQAFAMMNNLSNVSSYSADLSEWPLKSSRINYRAQALSLLDVKSTTLGLLMEQIGLAQPVRWTWCLHDRFALPSPPACAFEYIIVQRNFDPVTHDYTSYVNGTLYDYYIGELCPLTANPFAPLVADAVEFNVDQTQVADSFTAVADRQFNLGQFFISLTRDDIGGLRYLYAGTNINVEAADATSVQINQSAPQLLSTTNLALFTQQALTNNPAALLALYPTLSIISLTNFFVEVPATNITAFLTNFPNAPAGVSTLVLVTNIVPSFLQEFSYVFANVVTNHLYRESYIALQTNTISFPPNAPAGFFVTNFTSTIFLTPLTNGDIYIVPTNLCGYAFVTNSPGFTNGIAMVQTNTNVVVIAINTGLVTNVISSTFSILTLWTNYTYVVNPIQCFSSTTTSNSVALRGGIEKVSFVRRDFDSLLNSFWAPVTNSYSLTAITNGAPVDQPFQRVVTQPDMVFSAQDLTAGPGNAIFIFSNFRTFPNYNTNQELPGLAGPGTLSTATTIDIAFNKVGPAFVNSGPFFISGFGETFVQTNSVYDFQWGSFDGSTNAPVVYPSSTSLAALEAQVFFQITTALLPNASVRGNSGTNAYIVQLTALGAQPPYTWALAPSSPALPGGLSLSPTGVISGVPVATGIFDFTVQATDVGSRVTQKDLFLEIDP